MGEHQALDAEEPQLHGRASPGAAEKRSQGAAAQCDPWPDDPRFSQPPAGRNTLRGNAAHRRPSGQSAPPGAPASESSVMDQMSSELVLPTAILEARGAAEGRGQCHQQKDVDSETITPLFREFHPPAMESPGPPVPPASPRPLSGPGCGYDRWWPCVRSRKSRHVLPAG